MQIGKYTLIEMLKKESYKIIYSAQSDQQHFLVHEYADTETADHEFMVSSHLSGFSVDQFIDTLKSNGKTYLIQEDFNGVTADHYFNDNIPLSKKIHFAKSVLSLLETIHSKGVIYNNISIENISIGSNEEILFHNFTPAYLIGKNTNPLAQQLLNPHFVAPELTGRVEKKASASSDYYSFGILLYWLLTGKLPFEADNISQLIALHVAKQPLAPVSVNPQIPENLSTIVEKLLEKDPSSRYKSAEGILYDLEHFNEPGFQLASQDLDLKFKVSEKIYGREGETRQLREALEGLLDGKGCLVTIAGYSGVGKSTIVSEFHKTLASDECRFVSGKFQQYKKDIPYFAFVEAFEELLNRLLLSDQEVLDDFKTSFANSIGDQGIILTSIFPKLELIVGEQKPVDKLVGEEAENRFN